MATGFVRRSKAAMGDRTQSRKGVAGGAGTGFVRRSAAAMGAGPKAVKQHHAIAAGGELQLEEQHYAMPKGPKAGGYPQ